MVEDDLANDGATGKAAARTRRLQTAGASVADTVLSKQVMATQMPALQRLSEQIATMHSPAMESAMRTVAGTQATLAKQVMATQMPALQKFSEQIATIHSPAMGQLLRELGQSYVQRDTSGDRRREAARGGDAQLAGTETAALAESFEELLSWYTALVVFLCLVGHWLQYVNETGAELDSTNAILNVALPQICFMAGISKAAQVVVLRLLRFTLG